MSSLFILLLLMRLSGAIAISPNYISRSTEQQIIATVAPAVADDADVGQTAQPFLSSPSGLYAAYLRRAVDSSAGGPGADACYVQIQQADGGGSVWESDCTLVGGADACDLAFSPVGLELFAGGHSLWDTGIDADPGTLSLDDGGDMRIVSEDGVTVWKATGEPWSGQQCEAAMPASSSPSMDMLPPPSTTSAKLLTPPATTLAGSGSSDFSFGNQLARPADTMLDQPPVDTLPDQPLLPPPPADASPDSPDLPLPPPPADTYPFSPDQPLYSSPPPAPTAFVPQTPLPPVVDAPPLAPPSANSGETPSGKGIPPGNVAFPPAPVGGMPHQHGSPHHLPLGASPPVAAVPDALAPSGPDHGAAGHPFGQGQQQGVFGQQQQLLNGAGQPLEDSSVGRPRMAHAVVAVSSGLVGALIAVGFGF